MDRLLIDESAIVVDELTYRSYATQRRLGIRADVMARHFPGDCAAMEERFFETECDGNACAYCGEACIAPVQCRCPSCHAEWDAEARAQWRAEEREMHRMVSRF